MLRQGRSKRRETTGLPLRERRRIGPSLEPSVLLLGFPLPRLSLFLLRPRGHLGRLGLDLCRPRGLFPLPLRLCPLLRLRSVLCPRGDLRLDLGAMGVGRMKRVEHALPSNFAFS